MAVVSMPETAMNKDYGPVLGKYKVRFARQPFVMEEIAKASCMQASPDDQFGPGILAPDASHHPTAYF